MNVLVAAAAPRATASGTSVLVDTGVTFLVSDGSAASARAFLLALAKQPATYIPPNAFGAVLLSGLQLGNVTTTVDATLLTGASSSPSVSGGWEGVVLPPAVQNVPLFLADAEAAHCDALLGCSRERGGRRLTTAGCGSRRRRQWRSADSRMSCIFTSHVSNLWCHSLQR